MRNFSYLAMMILAATLSLLAPGQALAQSWKPMCVNGGNTAGAHNNTWQKVNTPGAGGSTWKRAGACVVPTCANGAHNYPTCTFPTCANGATDYPTCTPPLQPGIDLSGIPNPIVSASGDPNAQQWAQLMFGTDGVWSANTGDYDSNYPATGPNVSGRYLINGAVATDYEIMISNFYLVNGSTRMTASGDQQDNFLNRWTNAGTGIPGYQPVFQGLYGSMGCRIDGDCVGGGQPTATFTVTVRRIDNHAQTASINMTLQVYRSY